MRPLWGCLRRVPELTVLVNDAILANFLRSTFGPIGRDLGRRAASVADKANENASGLEIGVESGDLRGMIYSRIEQDAQGLLAKVGTTALKKREGAWNDFGYPAYWNANGKPWLTKALRDGIRDNT